MVGKAKPCMSRQNPRWQTMRKSAPKITSMLSSWTDTIEILKLIHVSDNNFNNVVNGTYPLTNLRNLEINLTFNQLLKLMSTTSSFSLPEDVTFNFVVKKEPLDDFGFPNTFPKVKRFVAKVNFWTPMTAEVLHRLSAIIKCFTDLEIAKIIINSDHCWRSHGFNEIVKFHEWLRDTNFSVPVNVNVSENVDISYLSENPQSMYDKLKSFGYKDDGSMNLCNTGFVIEKEYGNVKLIHHISHYDSFVCVSEY